MLMFFRVLLAWLFSAFFLCLVAFFFILTLRRYHFELGAPIGRFWARTVLKIVGIEVILENPSPFTTPKARICIVNHQSLLDLLWFGAIAPTGFTAIGKKELRAIFPINLAWWALKLHYIDRSNPTKAISSLNALAEDLVSEKRTAVISPEGTRCDDGEIGPFKKGAFHLACQCGIPLYPVIVAGAYELFPITAMLPLPGKIYVKFLDPIDTSDWTTDTLVEHVETTRNTMVEEYEALRTRLA